MLESTDSGFRQNDQVKCPCGLRSEEWVCEDVQREQEKRGTLELFQKNQEAIAMGKARDKKTDYTCLLKCDQSCDLLKKKREKELEEEAKQKQEMRKRKTEKEDDMGISSQKKQTQHKRTSRKWMPEEETTEERNYSKIILYLCLVVLMLLVVAFIIYLAFYNPELRARLILNTKRFLIRLIGPAKR